ncbi:hypothetical protein B7463_g4317, partial [Scytalidium lignicola]
MANFSSLPESIKQLHHSLEPYIHERQDVSHIRKILSAHLNRQSDEENACPKYHPLSLVDPIIDIDSLPNSLRGVRREYARCARANLKARKEYEELTRGHDNVIKSIKCGASDNLHSDTSLESFLQLVKFRQKYERLRILQDHFDMLEQQPATAADYLEPKAILQNLPSLPRAPLDVLPHATGTDNAKWGGLKQIADQLEKSVLNAKGALKREQKSLATVTSQTSTKGLRSPTNHTVRLEALGITRNELISWIENELSKAGESAPSDEAITSNSPDKRGEDDIETHLTLIQKQYARYNIARQSLICAAIGKVELPLTKTSDDTPTILLPNESPQSEALSSYIATPYLEEMIKVSNEQKSFIQQKSYLAISLAKQLKGSSQGLDLLVEESHLLPAHPAPAVDSKHKGFETVTSFGEELLNSEKPDMSHRARSWGFAAQSAGAALSKEISERLQDGRLSFAGTSEHLVLLRQHLENFGKGQEKATLSQKLEKDIWSKLDGNLGVIMREGGSVDLI